MPKRPIFTPSIAINGDGSFVKTETPVNQNASSGTVIKVEEFNGDDNPDILEIGASFYSIHLNNGAGGFSRSDYQRNLGQSAELSFADLNGDNKADIFFYQRNTSYIFSIFFHGLIGIIQYNQCQPFGETQNHNFDGNDAFDIVTWNPTTGEWQSKNGRWRVGIDPTVRSFFWGSGAHGDVPAPGDFDGDGKTDYAVYRNSTGNWYIFRSSDAAWYVFPFGLPGDIAVPNDYNGGGKTDIAVYRPSEGKWYIWLTETQQFQVFHFGTSTDKPVPADYDGDQKTDIAVYRASEGKWYYLRSAAPGFAVIHWGISDDIPVPADYDGDGLADIAVYRPFGAWYIRRSSNNSFNYFEWGTSEDIPIPFYSNGESADPTVYRPSNSVWYNYREQNSLLPFGASNVVPVRFGLPNN